MNPAKAKRAVMFVMLTASLFLVVVALSSRVRAGDYTLLQCLTHNYLEPGGQYQSLRRFREAEGQGKVDIVFFGSSHAYRGFDPRIFAAAGLRSMNLGSTNQTPLETYYLAERYLPKLSPDLVVVELFYPTLSLDGLESCRDLIVNTSWSWATMRMARATWNLGAMTYATAKGLGLAADDTKAEQREIPGEVYVPGGYCETSGHRAGTLGEPSPVDKVRIDVRAEQLAYLRDATALVHGRGTAVVWVTHPLPRDYRARLANRGEVVAALLRAAKESGVPYWPFDERMELDEVNDYADLHHLSASGVRKFDEALIRELRSHGSIRR